MTDRPNADRPRLVFGRVKSLLRICLVLPLYLSITSRVMGSDNSSLGTDFWVSYLYFSYSDYGLSYTVSLKAFVTAPRVCDVTFSNPSTGFSHVEHVIPGSVSLVDIDYNAGCTNVSGSPTGTAIHVTATDSIALYLLNLGHNSLDITNALPTPVLRSDYMVQCYPSKLSTDYRSEVVVVATENNTVVDITLGGPTMNGFSAGSTQTVTLQCGQAYQLRGRQQGEGDLTGTRITARDDKKIAVYSGHFCAYVEPNCASCDHIFDQALPTDYWGRKFVVRGTESMFPDHIRLMALEDDCEVTIFPPNTGRHLVTLSAGEVYDFTLSQTSSECYLESSSPMSVCLFMGSSGNGQGDPTLINIPPIDHPVKNATFATYSTAYTNTHCVNIFAKTTAMPRIRLDGNEILGSRPLAGHADFSTARVFVPEGPHTLTTTGEGFVAYAYGVGSHESYGFSVGMALANRGIEELYVNGICCDSGMVVDVCYPDSVELKVDVTGIADSVLWFRNNVFKARGLSYSPYPLPVGTYNFTAYVYRTDPDTHEPYCVILRTVVRVNPTYEGADSDTIARVDLPWSYGPWIFDRGGLYDVHFRTQVGCDSLIHYNLFVLPDTVDMDLFDTVCVDHPYEGYGFSIPSDQTGADGIFERMEDTVRYHLHLAVISAPTIAVTIEEYGMGYSLTATSSAPNIVWRCSADASFLSTESTIYAEAVGSPVTYYAEAYYPKGEDCPAIDSVVLEPLDLDCLWAPDVITPNLSTNNRFLLTMCNVKDFELLIFDRWGNLIFRTTDVYEPWDATYHSRPCMQGAYVWMVHYTFSDLPNQKQTAKGIVTVVR